MIEPFSSGFTEKISQWKPEIEKDQRYLCLWRGAHPKAEGTSFQTFAPHAQEVWLELTAYGKEQNRISMHRNDLGIWEAFSEHARVGRTYRFHIKNAHGNWNYRIDPFSFSLFESDGVISSIVTRIHGYDWHDRDWMQARAISDPLKKPLSIYELNVELWKKNNGELLSFRQLGHAIVEHHKQFPFTHVQLYGVLDHKNRSSWGYQVDCFFSPNHRMGNAEDFKYLVDLCHQHGIGVLLDWVPTHYKQDHCGDLSLSLHEYDGTNLFAAEESPWGTMYFDFDKEETRRFLMANALYWLHVYHIDGLRDDALGPALKRHGSTQWGAVNFFKERNDAIRHYFPGVLMIAEETDGFPNVTKPTWEGGLGFDVKVGMHLQSKMRYYFKTPYEERGKKEHHFDKLVVHLNEMGKEERWMLVHSHDDSASGFGHNQGTLHNSIPTDNLFRRFADMRLFHAWNLLTPGSGHCIHMGDELGQRWAWNERLTALEGVVEWHVLEKKEHSALLEYVGDLNRLYNSKPAFWKKGDKGYLPISNNDSTQVIGFHRLDGDGGRLALFYNFSPMGYTEYDFPLAPLQEDPEFSFVKGAREIFNSDGLQYGGTGNFKNEWAYILRADGGCPTHFRIALPPLSVVVFEEVWN